MRTLAPGPLVGVAAACTRGACRLPPPPVSPRLPRAAPQDPRPALMAAGGRGLWICSAVLEDPAPTWDMSLPGNRLELGAVALDRPLARERPAALCSILDIAAVEEFFRARRVKKEKLQSVYTHLFRRGCSSVADVPDLGIDLQGALSAAFPLTTSRVKEVVETRDGGASGAKLAIELCDGHVVETVVIHHRRADGKSHSTVCVSSQVGCSQGCKFCETGTMGLRANLSAGEILEQVWHSSNLVGGAGAVRNVVFMGMGEPLDNLPEVLLALRGLTHQNMFGLSFENITVSTVGLAEGIVALAQHAPRVNLALSLHAGSQEARAELMPHASRYPLGSIAAALRTHHEVTGAGVMIEYIAIHGANIGFGAVQDLGEFCRALPKCYVNVIPYNPTSAGARHGYEVPSEGEVEEVARALREDHGLGVKVRWSSARGREVGGACGQLAVGQPGRSP